MYNESDNLAVGYALGRDSNDNNNGWGNGAEWIWIIVLFALFGWGGNGFGGFGGGNGARYATQGDVQRGFDTSAIISKLDGINTGLCDGFYAMNTSLLTGFNGTERAIADLGYNLQNCCCQTQRAIDGVNYNMATNTCALQNTMNNNTRDIITSQQAGTQRILDFLCQEKISGLQSENAALTAQLSQNAQTSTIINTLRPVAQPAYITCSPYESIYGFGRNSGCGCNSCGC